AAERSHDLIDRRTSELARCLNGGAGNVRRERHLRVLEQRMFRWQRLWEKGVDTGRKKMTAIQRVIERGEVEDLTTPGIDDDGTSRQSGQFLCPDQAARLGGQLRHQYEELTLGQQRIKILYQLCIDEPRYAWVDVGIVSKHATIEAVFQLARDLGPD